MGAAQGLCTGFYPLRTDDSLGALLSCLFPWSSEFWWGYSPTCCYWYLGVASLGLLSYSVAWLTRVLKQALCQAWFQMKSAPSSRTGRAASVLEQKFCPVSRNRDATSLPEWHQSAECAEGGLGWQSQVFSLSLLMTCAPTRACLRMINTSGAAQSLAEIGRWGGGSGGCWESPSLSAVLTQRRVSMTWSYTAFQLSALTG